MSSVRRVLLTIALGAALGAGPAIAAPAMAKPNHGNNNSAKLAAFLNDNGVVGQAADSDGWGGVTLRVRSNGWVCYTYFIQGVAGAHDLAIYRGGWGDPNVNDDRRLTLASTGTVGQGCKKVSWKLAWALKRWPSQYNVQVDGTDGAIRGQLHGGGGNNNW